MSSPGFLRPIAREDEQQFAAVLRNRSGIDAGQIDFGLRDCTSLSEAEQQDLVDTCYALYAAASGQLGRKARCDV